MPDVLVLNEDLPWEDQILDHASALAKESRRPAAYLLNPRTCAQLVSMLGRRGEKRQAPDGKMHSGIETENGPVWLVPDAFAPRWQLYAMQKLGGAST